MKATTPLASTNSPENNNNNPENNNENPHQSDRNGSNNDFHNNSNNNNTSSSNNQQEPNKPEANKPKANKPKANKPKANKPKANKHKSNQSKPKPNKRSLGMRLITYLFLLVLLSVVLLSVVAYQTLFTPIEQAKRMLDVKKGQTYYSVIDNWQAKNQAMLPKLFSKTVAKLYVKLNIKHPLYIGTYQLPKNPTLYQTLSILQQGADVTLVKVQIIEGKTAKDLYQTLRQTKNIDLQVLNQDNKDMLSALGIQATTPKGEFSENLEGWFAPNTYFYNKGVSDKKILTDLYQRQQRILDKEWQNRAKGLPYKSPYEALIMASIIEKETGLVKERPLVAGVFVNRLRKKMRLQTDPTIIYGMGDRYKGNIRKKDIQEKTAYNTYQIDGLPPTPIALPSKEAIHASLHPAKTDALFFVATGKGGHKFSKTYAEHQKAVAEYLKVIRAKKD